MSVLAPITHILPMTLIRRERVLKIPGRVLVRQGQRVSASETIAETNLHPEHMLLDVSRILGLPAHKADEFIRCKAGDSLLQGDILVGPVGITRRVIRCPRDAQVILAGSGQILIELAGQKHQLKAGIPGEITDLIPDRGAVLVATGALIQGVWGNGHMDYGLLSVLAKTPDHTLTPNQLDVSLRGSIVLASYVNDEETLRAAADLPLRGLILASMVTGLLPVAVQMRYPILLLEGFGKRPINPIAFKLLTTNEQREVCLNAEPWDRYAGTRPEVIIPLSGPSNLTAPREIDIFAANQQVRVVRAPHMGEIGTILSLKGTVVFPSGLKAPAAEVRLGSGKNVTLPLANLEMIA